MKKERFFELMSQIDENLIISAREFKVRSNKIRLWLRLGVTAACFCLIIGIVVAIPGLDDDIPTPDDNIPTWEDAVYSANNIAELFNQTKDAAETNAYTEVAVTSSDDLHIGSISDDEYVSIYKHNSAALNKEEYKKLLDEVIPKLSQSLGCDTPTYFLENGSYIHGDWLYLRTEELGKYGIIGGYQDGVRQNVKLSTFTADDKNIVLNGDTVKIDPMASDAEITAALDKIKTKLFNIFGVSFDDVKIVRYYYSWSSCPGTVNVYFYDKDAHPLNSTQTVPISDYIWIETAFNSVDDVYFTDIGYSQSRGEYKVVANAKKTALAEAEELLHKGYVFSNHVCSICMASQDKESFEEYDFVDMEYIFEYDDQKDEWIGGIPFYAFYKQLGVYDNGVIIYAKTYVCAIEVSGYEEYFESQATKHKNIVWKEDEW